MSHPAGGPGNTPPPGGGPGWGQQYPPQQAPPQGDPAYRRAASGLSKAVLAAVAGAVVVVVAVVLVIVAPWSSSGGAGTDMSTDADGNDVATMALTFHPGWEWETDMVATKVDTTQYPHWQDPPKTVPWVAVNLDDATTTDLTMSFAVAPGKIGPWVPEAASTEAYQAAHFYYHGGEVTDNYVVDGMGTYVALGKTAPVDVNDLENKLALDGGELYTGGEDSHSLWENEPGFYLGFKTKAGSLGYITVTQVRDSPEKESDWDGERLDLTIAITYLARA